MSTDQKNMESCLCQTESRVALYELSMALEATPDMIHNNTKRHRIDKQQCDMGHDNVTSCTPIEHRNVVLTHQSFSCLYHEISQ